MAVLLKFSRGMDWLTERIGKSFMWFTMPIMALLIFEVVSRRFFNRPTEWNFFITKQFFGFFYLMMSPWGLLRNVNIRIDIWYAKWSAKTRALVDLLGYIFVMLPFSYIAVVYGGQYALNAFKAREASMSPMKIPIWHMKMLLPITFTLIGLQAISEIIKLVRFLRQEGKT